MVSEIIKASTRRGERLLERAACNQGSELYHVYGSFSSRKAEAMDDCKKMMREEGGKNFRIISHCTNFFSVAWELEYEGEPATHIEHRVIHIS